jgi:hypothetical protein
MTGTGGLNDFRRFFPAGKPILLVRDGRDATVSYLTAAGFGSRSRLRPDRSYLLWRFASNWAASGQRMLDYMAREEEWLLVRFEDIHADPCGQMQRVAEFLGLPAPAEWLDAARNLPVKGSGFYRAPGESEQAGRTQWGEVERTTEFQPVGRWKEKWTRADRAIYRAAVGDTAARLGYD